MLKLNCKDLDPSSNCDFVAGGGTKEELMASLKGHVSEVHPDKAEMLNGMSEEDIMKHVKEEGTSDDASAMPENSGSEGGENPQM